MNKQTEILVDKAGLTAVYEMFDNELKTFVELIVQECVTFIEPTDEHRRDASWGFLGGEEGVELLDELVSKIKQHFGVDREDL